MDIAKIDKNLALNDAVVKDGKSFYAVPNAVTDLYGVFYDQARGRFLRLDSEVAASVNDGVKGLNAYTAGGRLRFSTNSKTFAIQVTYDSLPIMSHMPISAATGFMLLKEDDKIELVNMLAPASTSSQGFEGVAKRMPTDGEMHDYILHFPLYGTVNSLTLVLDEDARLEGGKKYRAIKPILYYGSSITQGGCASRADASYQAMISKWNNIDFINLGFSGSARGEKEMAEYLSKIDCSLFVCDYDYNAPNAAHLEKTHYPLYQAFRSQQPDTPILFLSSPDFDKMTDGAARSAVIRSTYEKAKANGDNRVWFVEGRLLFEKEDRDFCTVDGCHPNDLGFYRMAKKIYAAMKEIDTIFE